MISPKEESSFLELEKNLVYPVYKEDSISEILIEGLGADINSSINNEEGKITEINTLGKLKFEKIYFVGLGSRDEISTEKLRKIFEGLAPRLKEDCAFFTGSALNKKIGFEEIAYLFTESYELGAYKFKKISIKEDEEKEINIDILANYDITAAIDKGLVYAEAVNNARHLINRPSNMLNPSDLAMYAKIMAKELKIDCKVLGNRELEKMGAGALLAVNKGSENEAKLICLKYNGDPDTEYTTALVGKGITFDAGGYNIKTNMDHMKTDMAGAASVMGVMEIIAKRKLRCNVIAVIPATENLINGKAYKRDDVILSLAGKTIEIVNTDAEGRLVLADGIEYAIQNGAKRIVDIATLTGACKIALGNKYTGVFSNNDGFYEFFSYAANCQDEKIWRMPLDEDFRKDVRKSMVADLNNCVIGKGAGSSYGATFLQEFIPEGMPWIHLDVAGTARSESGATGVMIRSIAQMFEN